MLPPLAFLAGDIQLPLSLLLVFGAAKILAELCERIHVPGVVGGLMAGILLGPSALRWIEYREPLNAFAELGVMFLLFQVGLEIKPTDLLRVGKTAMAVAVLGVVLPFLFGWGIMAAVGRTQIEAIFLGAALVATSVGITAQILASKGLLSHHTSRIILAAAVIDDVLGLLVLAVVSSAGAAGGVDFLGIGTTAAASILFVVAIVKFGAPTVNRVLPRLRDSMRAAEAEFTIAVIFLFFMALVATYSGVAAIIGAFLAGMALSETASRRVHTLAHGAGELMIPFFLASIGLQLDLGPMGSLDTLALALVVVLAAIVSKGAGCALGAWNLGFRDAARIGAGMVPRGEVGLVVAQVGLKTGNVSQEVYGLAVFMAVATTVIAPLLLNLTFRGLAPLPEAPDEEETPRIG
jgi:Kef-type K+ transport system membrane component KefB